MERRRQKTRNRRLMLALLMLLVSGIALTTATYAWFSANTVVTTEDIDVKVVASSGISISADAVAYGKEIKYSDVVAFAKKVSTDTQTQGILGYTDAPAKTIISNPEKLNPVTTIGQDGTGSWKFFQGQLNEDDDTKVLLAKSDLGSGWKSADSNYTNGDYIAFDVYVRTSTAQDVRISDNSRIKDIKLDEFTSGEREHLDAALRVGYQYLGSTPKTGQRDAYQINIINGSATEDSLASKNLSQWAIWNPMPWEKGPESIKTYYGAYEASTYDGLETANGYYAGINTTGGNFVPHYYKDSPSADYFKSILTVNDTKNHYLVSTKSAETTSVPTDQIFRLEAGVNKIRIYIWLEGQDKDCVDSITLSDGISLNLGFQVIKN